MGIFAEINDFCTQKVENALDFFTDRVLKLSRVTAAVDAALDGVNSALLTIENGLKTLANLAKGGATTLRLNPLASGPLKLVFRLVAAFLETAEGLFDGARLLVRNFRRVIHKRLRRKIDDLIDRINKRIDSVVGIIGRIRVVVRRIEGYANRLALQEDLLPAPAKAEIRASFASLYYNPVPGVEGRLRASVDAFDPIVRDIEARVKAVNDAFDDRSGLSRAIAPIQNTVGSVLQRIADLARAVKKFIDENLSFLGLFLDAIEFVIDKAFELLGVNRVLEEIKRRLGNVPFVKEAREFVELVERAEQQIQAQLDRLAARLDGIAADLAEGAGDTLNAHTNGTFEFIARILMQKLNVEKAIPQAAAAAIARAGAVLERDVEIPADEAAEVVSQLARQGRVLSDLALQGGESFFFRDEAERIRDFLLEKRQRLVPLAGLPAPKEYPDARELAQSVLEAAQAVLEIGRRAAEAATRLGPGYFAEAAGFLREDVDKRRLGAHGAIR